MTRKLQIQDLFRFRFAGDIQVCPRQRHLAYVLRRLDADSNSYRTNILLQSPAAGSEPVQFTGHDSDSSPRFSPDGEQLAFLSRRSGQNEIWLMPVSGGEARRLTRTPNGVLEFNWSPASERIAFIALLEHDGLHATAEADQDHSAAHTDGVITVTELFHKMDGVGYLGAARACLCITGTDGADSAIQLTQPPYALQDPVWSEDESLIYVRGRMNPDDYDRGGSEMQVWSVPSAGGAARLVSPVGMTVSQMAPSPDGTRLAMVGAWTRGMSYDNLQLFILPAGAPPAITDLQPVLAHYDYPLGDKGVADAIGTTSGRLAWQPDGASLIALVSEQGSTYLVSIDLAAATVRQFTPPDQHIYSWAVADDGKTALYVANEPLRVSVVKQADVASGEQTTIASLNESLHAELELSEPERFKAHAADGPAVDAWLLRPHGFTAGASYPAILSIHGGPALMYTPGFFFELQLLAAQGYAVIYANPRGSQSYGAKYCQAIQFEWGNADYEDLMAVVDQALADNEWIDGNRLGVTGGSYGGYMTNWIVGHTDRFAAAVTGRSISDWRSAIGSGDLGTFRFNRVKGVPFWDDNSWYEQQSPITYVGNVRTPILIEHQANDYRCTLDQAMMWYSAIKYLNKAPVRMVIYPDEGHDMSRTGKPWHRIHRLREITAWFAEYLS